MEGVIRITTGNMKMSTVIFFPVFGRRGPGLCPSCSNAPGQHVGSLCISAGPIPGVRPYCVSVPHETCAREKLSKAYRDLTV